MRISIGRLGACLFAQIITGSFAFGQVLTHGPVIGGVTASTANVFVRTDQQASVVLWFGTDPNLEAALISQTFQTSSMNDFTKSIPLTNLTADTIYYMNVVVNGVPQTVSPPYASFKTFAPAGTSRSFNFVVFTDFGTTSMITESVPTFASAAAENPVFAFIGGDFDHRNPQTLDDKRQMFKDLYDANTHHMEDFVNLILHKIPIVHQWDDHDSGLNNVDKNYTSWNLNQQVYQEYVPTYPLPSVSPGIWQKFSYAQAEFFVLDCRSQRDPGTDRDDVNKSMLDGNNLGATGQLQWLENGLLTSTAQWKVIFTSVITNPTTKQNDAWGAYQTEWNALKNFININNIQGVVFISGDLHLGAIDNGTQAGFPEMCVGVPNYHRDDYCATAALGTWSEGYYNDDCAGYGLVSISRNPDQLTLQTVDEFGAIHISYTIPAGTPAPTPTPTPSPTPSPSPSPTPTPSATPIPPSITTQPAGVTVNMGQTARFRVKAAGSAPLHYQWRKNDVNIPRATKASYTTPPTVAADNGSMFSVVVTNGCGSVTSNNAMLTVR